MRRVSVLVLACACAHDPAVQDCGDTDEACTTTSDSGSTGPSSTGTSPSTVDSSDAESGATITATTSAPDTSETSDVSSTTAPDCTEDSDCSADAPFCEIGTCLSCDHLEAPDAGCAGLNPDLPLCVDEACVQCSERDATMCTGIVPICDTASHTCVGCTMHEQCPGSACDRIDGSCFPLDLVLHVDGDAGSCFLGDGSEMLPFCTIDDALDAIAPASRAMLRIAATALPYLEPIVIDGDRIVAIVPWGDDSPVLDMIDAAPTVVVDGATAYLWRVRLEGNGSAPAIALEGAVAYVESTTVVLNSGGGLVVTADTELHLWNSVIGANGTGLAERYAMELDASTFDVLDTTIAGNDSTGPASLWCSGGATGTIRNSIVVGLELPSIQCAGVEVVTSAIDTADLGGDDVLVLDEFNVGWFVDAPAGDFHLVSDTLFEALGVRVMGDPVVDLDGDPRPTRDGAPDVVGADVP